MNNIVIDTNPLAYIYNGVLDLGKKYALLLGELARGHILMIPKIVYGELSLIFEDVEELKGFIDNTGIVLGEASADVYITAASRWKKYNERRVLMCHRCGARLDRLTCKKCASEINIRQHILSDFIIGAFARHTGNRLVTHDKGYFSTYFPELNIITAPD
ncbi:MAG: hypothetical protein ACOCWY_01920 [Thermodesulfobacteriota bacterium]